MYDRAGYEDRYCCFAKIRHNRTYDRAEYEDRYCCFVFLVGFCVTGIVISAIVYGFSTSARDPSCVEFNASLLHTKVNLNNVKRQCTTKCVNCKGTPCCNKVTNCQVDLFGEYLSNSSASSPLWLFCKFEEELSKGTVVDGFVDVASETCLFEKSVCERNMRNSILATIVLAVIIPVASIVWLLYWLSVVNSMPSSQSSSQSLQLSQGAAVRAEPRVVEALAPVVVHVRSVDGQRDVEMSKSKVSVNSIRLENEYTTCVM